ncbi:hypothetical protein [Streptomyces botrytidirepellens]|uniref:hypothetical protein n=1 Tax=Streptomyces botrytidirepellens TaxID=2486417 RepID=UPI0011CDDDF6|nr:hypothetical protein [Streptomyces botrytidirepellens]
MVMELADPPALWWDLARRRAQMIVLWLPDARHPTNEEIVAALNSRSGWMASARRVPPARTACVRRRPDDGPALEVQLLELQQVAPADARP